VVAGSLVELASRLQLMRVPLSRSWQRAQGLPRSAYAMTMAHVGLGVLVAGITASSAWQSEAILVMKPGDRAEVAGYQFTLARIDEAPGPNYVARRATFDVSKDGAPVARIIPQKRFYPVEQQATSEGDRHGALRTSTSCQRSGRRRGQRAPIPCASITIPGHVDLGGVIIMGLSGRCPHRPPPSRRCAAPARALAAPPAGRARCTSVCSFSCPLHIRRGWHRARGRPDPRSSTALPIGTRAGLSCRRCRPRGPASGVT
jgi:cytochrome c-type biogenesis protein CcmF